MLLGAGRGTRLSSVEPDLPKVLVDIGGEPLLARQLKYLEGQGISRVVVNTHHLANQVLAFARQYKGSSELVVVVEEQLLGTSGGVRNALPMLEADRFIVLYGDVLTSEPLASMVDRHVQRGAAATLGVYESQETEGKGIIEGDNSGRVRGFREKTPSRAGEPALINAGVYVIEASFARQIPAGIASDFGHDIFPAAVARGDHLAIHKLAAPVLDVGTPSTLELARRIFQGSPSSQSTAAASEGAR